MPNGPARPPGEALALGPELLDEAARSGLALFSVALVEGPFVSLGAGQRAGRVVDLEACARQGVEVFRRATTGTAACAGRLGLAIALALPDVASLFPDAGNRTLLNRNVRPLLRALGRLGPPGRYFGREWIAAGRRPALVVGFEVREDRALLLEAIGSFGAPPSVPEALAAPEERRLDRFRGLSPAGLDEVLRGTPEAVALAFEAALSEAGARAFEPARLDPSRPVPDGRDPLPVGLALLPLREVAVGYLEAACGEAGAWLGGDLLAPRFLLAALADSALRGRPLPDMASWPMEGARPEDLRALAEALGPPSSGRS